MILVSRWRVEATLVEAADILAETEALPRWWSEVCLEAKIAAPGDPEGIGRRFEGLTRGWLHYRLHWQGIVREAR